MAKFINLACSNLDKGDHNAVAKVLSSSNKVLDWNSPQDGQFILKCANSTKCQDIGDIANINKNIRLFVSTFNPDHFAFCIRSDWHNATIKRLESYSIEQRQEKKQEEERAKGLDINLLEGFNQKAITLPNGVRIQINENGEIFIQEKDASPKKIRNNDKVMKFLIS